MIPDGQLWLLEGLSVIDRRPISKISLKACERGTGMLVELLDCGYHMVSVTLSGYAMKNEGNQQIISPYKKHFLVLL